MTLDGLTYTNVGSAASTDTAALFFTGGPVVLPIADQDFVTLVAPFLLTGSFSALLFATPIRRTGWTSSWPVRDLRL